MVLKDNQKMDELINIGIALASEVKLDRLLDKILEEARRFTQADAGSLYLKEDDRLHFVVSQNDSLRKKFGIKCEKDSFLPFTIPVSTENIAGYVAKSATILNIEDVYEIPDTRPYRFNRSFDERSSYRSRSMLAVPMMDVNKEIIGVIQLINSMDDMGNVIPFRSEYEKLTLSLASQAGVAVKNAQLRDEVRSSSLEMIERLSVAAEFRDEDTALHIKRMSSYSAIIATKMGYSYEEAELLRFTSPMHDIGKIGVPDSILLKPGKLTDEEWQEMRRHTVYGAEILGDSQNSYIKSARIIALSHHEKWDGSGYPNGLKGDEIPLEGRIVALADVFDALSSKRCYKDAMPIEKVKEIIREGSGKHFDPGVVSAFFDGLNEIIKVYEEYKEI